MRKLVVTAFISADGVMQAPGGPDEDRDGGFGHGGWAVPFVGERVLEVMSEFTRGAGALLLGRRTYEEFAATWPLADDPHGDLMNGLPKYVASRTLGAVGWRNTTLLRGKAAETVAELKRGDGGDIQVHGSSGLIQTLLAHDLADEFQLLVFPVLTGPGKRLFGDGTAAGGLELTHTERLPRGGLLHRYTRAGKLEYGAMGPETGNW
ncbi:dihydrofolate reductase family protein [Amycolatopsis endophytica]|uniref:Dihydrofolate reductase n=1 Tax=Amycolatopsis endophytica TaxID=860233 RepID=A0A853BBQ7_9PSEU|nr:dihydrofolate reductase family protein [Amycolatopsis endophytica]NYI92215.1 dihydrofolate reductase [Amycolatopsis endophytica]